MVDDDPHTLHYVRNTLTDAGYAPMVTGDLNQVSSLLESERPQLVLLNLVLADVDWFELLKRIRAVTNTPVVVLSGPGPGQDIAKAFEFGAADYMLKPFCRAELVARIGAALRWAAAYPHSGMVYESGDLVIDHFRQVVTVAGEPLYLTPTEYNCCCNSPGIRAGS